MGGGSFTARDWSTHTATKTTGKTTEQVFTSRAIKRPLDPRTIQLRESLDSPTNPASTALVIGLDVTGSMGHIADMIARDGLKTLFEAIYDRKPISDPQIAFMGIGDADYDSAPLQVSQFEADIRIADQLTDLYLEHGGGGNQHESYTLPWHFCATRTTIDCFNKRKQKGFLFTVGDELPPDVLTARQLQKIYGNAALHGDDISSADLLAMVEREWHVFHVIIEQGDYAKHHREAVVSAWVKLLGQRALRLSDYTKLAELIVSTIQVVQGADPLAVAKSWKGDTSLVIAKALGGLTTSGRADPDGVVAV